MFAKKNWYLPLCITFLHLMLLVNPCLAQQPLLKFKPNPLRPDSFDFIYGISPFQIIFGKLGLNLEMRLKKNKTLKISTSYRQHDFPYFIEIQSPNNLSQFQLSNFDEHVADFRLKRYKISKKSRVYFGPYLAVGLNLRRALITMETHVQNFETIKIYSSTKRQSVYLAIGSTKLVSKNIIFDVYTAIRFQFMPSNTGQFTVTGLGYKEGLGGFFGFSIGWPLGKNTP